MELLSAPLQDRYYLVEHLRETGLCQAGLLFEICDLLVIWDLEFVIYSYGLVLISIIIV